uniref:LUD domain-containing protein n=1 Tax=Shigella flexneri TaxID=623 RepID=UPI00209570FA
GDQSVVISGDTRLEELGISERLQQECNAVVWDPAKGAENISQAEQAKVGVVYAEYGLTESGGVVLFSAVERGRSLSLLPESSLFILRKSTMGDQSVVISGDTRLEELGISERLQQECNAVVWD